MTADARVVAPGVTVHGNASTGTGDACGRPIPTEERETADIFERLEAGRTRRAIRSPIVLQGPSPAPTAAAKAERAADAQRFTAPSPTPAPEPSTPVSSSPHLSAAPPAAGSSDPTPPRPHVRGPVSPPVPPEWEPGPARTRRGGQVTVNDAEVTRRYQAGETPPQIGQALGHTAATIRRSLDRSGVQRRDDRHEHSGSERIDYDPQLVEQVRRLYIDDGLTQHQVAAQLGVGPHVVQRLMERHNIQARPANHLPRGGPKPRLDGEALRQQLADLGITNDVVRRWARAHDYGVGDRGAVPAHVIDAYLTANPQEVPA